MNKVEIAFRIEGGVAPLATYGSLWRLPRRPGDEPLCESLVIPAGGPVPLEVEEGPLTYYFAFSGQGEDDAFELVVVYADSGASIGTLRVETKSHAPRFFRFEV